MMGPASGPQGQQPGRPLQLWVGKLPPTSELADEVVEQLLRAAAGQSSGRDGFARGQWLLLSWKRVRDPETAEAKGFGFAQLATASAAQRVLQLVNGLRVKEASLAEALEASRHRAARGAPLPDPDVWAPIPWEQPAPSAGGSQGIMVKADSAAAALLASAPVETEAEEAAAEAKAAEAAREAASQEGAADPAADGAATASPGAEGAPAAGAEGNPSPAAQGSAADAAQPQSTAAPGPSRAGAAASDAAAKDKPAVTMERCRLALRWRLLRLAEPSQSESRAPRAPDHVPPPLPVVAVDRPEPVTDADREVVSAIDAFRATLTAGKADREARRREEEAARIARQRERARALAEAKARGWAAAATATAAAAASDPATGAAPAGGSDTQASASQAPVAASSSSSSSSSAQESASSAPVAAGVGSGAGGGAAATGGASGALPRDEDAEFERLELEWERKEARLGKRAPPIPRPPATAQGRDDDSAHGAAGARGSDKASDRDEDRRLAAGGPHALGAGASAPARPAPAVVHKGQDHGSRARPPAPAAADAAAAATAQPAASVPAQDGTAGALCDIDAMVSLLGLGGAVKTAIDEQLAALFGEVDADLASFITSVLTGHAGQAVSKAKAAIRNELHDLIGDDADTLAAAVTAPATV